MLRSLACVGALGIAGTITTLAAESTKSDSDVTADNIQEIVVTATRRAEPLSKVAQSVTALSESDLETRGIKDMSGIALETPGLQLDPNGFGNQTVIAIRGVSSNVGAATTGIYIDDTPIQSRQVGYSSTNAFPLVFDLDRVEVLRGPQGTLFGAGSEGGTVRFITSQPSLTAMKTYARLEGSGTEDGGPSGEAGVSLSVPLVENRLGLLVSAWTRRDGGYVDRYDSNPEVINVPRSTNANWTQSTVFRSALKWVPIDDLEVTPSIYYQKRNQNDSDNFFENLSNPTAGDFISGQPQATPDHDRFYLPALGLSYRLDGLQLVNSLSYYVRDQASAIDYSTLWPSIFIGSPFVPGDPGYRATAFNTNKQRTLTEELRLQSDQSDSPFDWVAGIFFSRSEEEFTEDVLDPDLGGITGVYGLTVEQFFGQGPLLPGGYSLHGDGKGTDKQIAGFADVSYSITSQFKATAGVRYALTKFTGSSEFEGPIPGVNVQPESAVTEHPVTPKFGLSYQATPDLLLYATAAKGYRIGGVNAPANNSTCTPALALLGFSAVPDLYKSDSLWSYEAGLKGKAAGGRFGFAASGYHVDWSQIQQAVDLTCGASFIANLGKATSNGFDVQESFRVLPQLTVDSTVSYTDAHLSGSINVGGSSNLASEGDHLETHPWTATLGATFEQPFTDSLALYARADYAYKSHGEKSLQTDPADASYVVGATELESVKYGSLRGGVRHGPFDISLFINNITNSHPSLSRTTESTDADHNPVGPFRDITLRPRTYGLSFVYRN